MSAAMRTLLVAALLATPSASAAASGPAASDASSVASSEAAPDAAPDASPEDLATAREAIEAAKTAASEGDYLVAVENFERAMELHPLPQLQYNIAICHHRRAMEAEPGSEAYESAKQDAIAAYNRYLELAPDAPDHTAVEETVTKLGGKPFTKQDEPWTPELLRPEDVPDPPEFADPLAAIQLAEPQPEPQPELQPEPAPEPTATTTPAQPPSGRPPVDESEINPTRVSLGSFVPLMLSNPVALSNSSELSSVPMIGLGLRGGGFMGTRRRVYLGGELSIVGQPVKADARHGLRSGWLGLVVAYEAPLGKRLVIGGGGLVAVTGQTLHYTGSDPLRCGVRSSGAISQRSGVLLGGRFRLAVLLGKRKRHALGLRITPALVAHGRGSASQDEGDASMGEGPCRDEPTPFETFGLDQGAGFSAIFDLGYEARL